MKKEEDTPNRSKRMSPKGGYNSESSSAVEPTANNGGGRGKQ